MIGQVAIVLHAHLPYVRHPEHARSLEERWLHEALWESYLPLLGTIARLAAGGIRAPLTISISPTLASMLRDDLLRRRFDDHLVRLDRLASRLSARTENASFSPAIAHHRARLAEARAIWDRAGGDVLGAFAAHHREGRVELVTTAATHAYLPGLLTSPASIRAQLRLGLRSFEALSGVRPRGLWLPECAWDPRLGDDLAAAGVRFTVLDAHGIELARPRPPLGITAPILGPSGVAFFARDPAATRDVWSRQAGYPGDPWYRDFYRDVGFDLPEADLAGELGPRGRIMTGLKLHRITGPGSQKEPYLPERAEERAREHARHFVAERESLARDALPAHARAGAAPPIVTAPFDAELFGHWWFEGPSFLEHTLRALDASAREGRLEATTLGERLERFPEAWIAEPAASTWGEGGFGSVWTGPEAARLLRHVHHMEARVRGAVARGRDAGGVAERAVDQAIRELLLLEASDWPFMIQGGETAEYAELRVRAHANRAARLVSMALSPEHDAGDLAWLRGVCDKDRFLAELEGPAIRDAFDSWG